MDDERVVEHGEGGPARWMRERRLRVALFIAFVESLVVLFSAHGWRYVIIAAIVALAAYWFLGRRRGGLLYEITWVAAVSQLCAVLVPVLWVLVKTVAIIVLVGLALFLLVALLLDRR
ncbi:MAG TPA: hypothetical protein VH281_08035 [Gaiellaceae bacterium]|jgi:hypothetical protein